VIRAPRRASGFVAIELVASVALLFVPTLVLVASIPVWSERRHAATVIARESARAAAASWPSSTDGDVEGVVASVAADYGVPEDEVQVSIAGSSSRGGQAVARVTVVMPALHLPFIGDAGAWHWTTIYSVRIDDYRSR
jgi:hypothetical protein